MLACDGESSAVFDFDGVSLKLLLLGDSNSLDSLEPVINEPSFLVGVLGQAEGAISVSKAAVDVPRKLLLRGE